MKIICIEEHTSDPSLAEAAQPSIEREAPYAADLGSRYQEAPDTTSTGRPNLVSPAQAAKDVSTPIEARLPEMDAHGIDVQVLSYSNAAQAAPAGKAADLSRRANDRLAEAVARHPTRFAGFSTLPWQDPGAAVRELQHCDKLGLTATMLIGHPGEDTFLDEPRYAPVLAKLEELAMPVYIHPGPPLPVVQRPYYGGLEKEVTARLSLYGWGWHNEAGVQVIRLILSGALDRHPNLRIISGHWGEMVPFFLDRLDDALPPGATGLSRTVSQTYRDHVSVTPSGMLYLPHFRFIHELLGAERIVFSVDYPYLTMTGARAWLEALPVNEDERAAIAHKNAERLLRLEP